MKRRELLTGLAATALAGGKWYSFDLENLA
jgi:hypothetical protein